MSGRSYGGETSDERLARRRRQLLDAGLEIFGTTGYRTATVRQLCREAGVTDRYFYEQFDQTEDLLLAVYAACIDELTAAVQAAVDVDGVDLDEYARASLDAFLKVVEDDPRLARVVWFEVLGVSLRVEQTHLNAMAMFGAFIADVAIRRAGRTPQRGVDTAILSEAAAGGVSQAVMGWVNRDFSPSRRAMVKTLTRYLVGIGEAASHA